uniref:non-specific serine/threonine protein kinase n=1 Tax=Manihot esculenta TaxID=3983 RepID=A0A2C9UZW7_MANES
MVASRKLEDDGTNHVKLQYFLFLLLRTFAFTAVVKAQDQSGFISIDCGVPDNASYTDKTTYLNYVSDAAFIDTGISMKISPEFRTYDIDQQLQNLRSFPEGNRNCYNVGLKKGSKYLIRATFMYGNYDGQNKAPQFDIHLGSTKWDTVETINATMIITKEIIHVTTMSYLLACLANTGSGTPFISALEFRPLKNASYNYTESGSLVRFTRLDIGSTTNQTVRYPEDVYDRIWAPYHSFKWAEINTSQSIDSQAQNNYRPPSVVMRTAGTPANASEAMTLHINMEDNTLKFLVYMHFSEIVRLQANQSREFNISFNGKHWFGPVVPNYLYTTTVYSRSALTAGQYQFTLYKTECSTLPPLLNAIEIYYVLPISQSQTNQEDGYLWDGLNCSNSDNDMLRIISLNLSSSGLTGEITRSISSLKLLESLDLSNNSLTGSVPDFLSQMSSLKFLNLTGNKLSGSVPTSLIERSKQNLLVLSKKDKNWVVPVVASIAGGVIAIGALAIIFCSLKRRKQKVDLAKVLLAKEEEAKTNNAYESLKAKGRHFTYSEILSITNNFERVLGKGGFGTVYHGYLDDDTQVAVKMLSPSSVQGYRQFQAEVNLLLRVHHRNLTTLVGFCDEGTNRGLIYEYMVNGDLEKFLSGSNKYILTWERRLNIVVEAAKGWEYLHNGSKPPIVHRDVKTSNILLNDNFQARLADFGLSRSFPVEGGTHVTTVVAGTPGYLDPEYSVTNWLTEKSDVYSFGVVLLKIITGRPVIAGGGERNIHLRQWVSSLLANGDIKNVVDPRLGGDFDNNSVWKAVEIAMACTTPISAGRPTMHQVVTELNECLATERTEKRKGHSRSEPIASIEMITESTPLAR